MSAPFAIAFCSIPLCGFPDTISQEFLSQLHQIDFIAQKIFDHSDSVRELKTLVSFRLKMPSIEEFILEGIDGPSEEKIKLMYAAATVMAVWMKPFPKFTYETYRQIIFTNIFRSQKYDICYLPTFCYLKSMQKDPFWKKNLDILEAIQLLHMRRMSLV